MVKRSKKRNMSASEADLLAMRLRRENMVAFHKATQEEYKVRQMIQTAEKIKNYQNEYGNLLNAHSRLPIGLQGPALSRMRDLGQMLTGYKARFPGNFPEGAMPQERIPQGRLRRQRVVGDDTE